LLQPGFAVKTRPQTTIDPLDRRALANQQTGHPKIASRQSGVDGLLIGRRPGLEQLSCLPVVAIVDRKRQLPVEFRIAHALMLARLEWAFRAGRSRRDGTDSDLLSQGVASRHAFRQRFQLPMSRDAVPDEQFHALIRSPGPARYKHAVSQVADRSELWSLENDDGFVTLSTDDGRFAVPIWPRREYAAACVGPRWENARPTAIPMDKWVAVLVEESRESETAIAVFPLPDGTSVLVPVERFAEDVDAELSLLE
jgi:hypothetical protein